MRSYSGFTEKEIETQKIWVTLKVGDLNLGNNFRIPVLDNYSRLLLYIGIPQDLIPDPGSKPS